MSEVKLQCCLYEPNCRHAFGMVSTAANQKIFQLQKDIYGDGSFHARFKDICANDLKLFCVSILDSEIGQYLSDLDLSTLTPLSPTSRVSDAYTEQPLGDSTHLLIVKEADIPSPPAASGLIEIFGNLRITTTAPSQISKHREYTDLQGNPDQRILDDRPSADSFVTPIALLYDGFGIFDDIRDGFPVDGEHEIANGRLWDLVGGFAQKMAEFHVDEGTRRQSATGLLNDIFRARTNPETMSQNITGALVDSRTIRTDGHVNGGHDAMVFCFECKNELSTIKSEPCAELVAYIASSFANEMRSERHQYLFTGWRTPCLGMTLIGAYIQFWGIIMLSQPRVEHLTPMLPLVSPEGNCRSRNDLFLALKAASIVRSRIQSDVQRLLQNAPLPTIPNHLRNIPSVTEINDIDSTSIRIKFTLGKRYDNEVSYRHLYHAHLEEGQGVYVKFTRRYSLELHKFCASHGLAPRLLGFERLAGGWYGVVMEKVDTTDVLKVESSPDLETWKKDIWSLVHGFHQMGLVHGDLRLANFIFTKNTNPRRMMVVDFDWGGEDGEVVFPRGPLVEELGVGGGLDRIITKDHDDRVLAKTFEVLDGIAAARSKPKPKSARGPTKKPGDENKHWDS
ncbi:hypothetical protein BDM02DRAFT_3117161 [Thelephora ganbajun]|uniref:Uncharacterized protein n=1 Tax=Thelephora ganbajun TaxID=370292 RepID=A0ACB6ZDH2_THEGA|nr:hypothetical protein BDM02DRAFT_3117161 [Thelephora ganbajun]